MRVIVVEPNEQACEMRSQAKKDKYVEDLM
jgi:hypothetical protein